MNVNIPESHRKAFVSLTRVEAPKFDSIVSSLRSGKPSLRLADLRRRVREAAALALHQDAEILADAIVALAASSSHADFRPDLVTSVAATVADSEALDLPARKQLESRLIAILGLPAVAVSAKSSLLQVAHDRVFNASKIVTDIRPVFLEPLGPDWAYMIIHHLQMTCRRGGRQEEIFVSMDDRDLEELHEAISRARAKAALLRSSLEEKHVAAIDGGGA